MERIRPYRKTFLADLETPVTAYLKLAEKAPVSFLLESVERGRQSRFSIVGVGARRTFRLKDGVFTVNGERVETRDPLRALYERVYAPLERHPDLPPFFGGVVGYAAYDLVRYYERLPSLKPDDLGLPDLLFVEPEVVAVFDHLKNLLHLVAPGRARFQADFSREAYLEAVRRALDYIRAGDIFQVVLSLRLSSPLTVHPFALYRALRSVNPSPYMGYLDLGEVVLVSASPESLLRSDGRRVVTRPIAGTRPRGKDEEEDKRLAEELLRDEKEVAEHVMLLDLSRNDIGRVAAFGTVRVLEPLHVEHYSHVMHLVSTVEGILAEGKTPLDALASVLPMGTVSGAPKIRAMEIIEELEPHRRGPYGGSFGYLAYDGAMDMALTLRTFVVAKGWMHVQAGAGIVADSVPEREYEECWNKARALLKAVEMAEAGL